MGAPLVCTGLGDTMSVDAVPGRRRAFLSKGQKRRPPRLCSGQKVVLILQNNPWRNVYKCVYLQYHRGRLIVLPLVILFPVAVVRGF
ncbi:hypothetical protein CC80DRAFT_281648 [Byssothecium circinans]|uniref:Uncharacterized protein n=1 Tax=Byssothecium circinans TaxID=147558 RepID=A0A6A5TBB7_9PLEO|nr:hypothetical protein CC80DRAFT_281648 [Byssothecium circinans]